MNKRWFAVAGIGAAVLLGGCGSSTNRSGAGAGNTPTITQSARAGGAEAPGLTLRRSEFGRVIFASNDRALYVFSADHGGKSACYGACASAWPPLLATEAPKVSAGLNAGLLGSTRRIDGTMQLTYGGRPLYSYTGDTPGKVMCQGANVHGGFWYVVDATGSPVLHGHSMMGHSMMGHEHMKGHGKRR